MKHLIKKENNIIHGTLGWSHNGKDGQYCEAGETVKIKWQPNAGWGLKEVHYTDGDGNVVAIEDGEFVMPDSAVVIGATFKRFFLSDWADNPYNPQPQPAGPKCLTFTAGAGGASLAFFFNRNAASEEQQNPNIIFQKSTDGGLTWEEHTIGVYDPNDGDTADLDVITLNEGESVMFKGVNSENFTVGDPENEEGVSVGFYLEGNAAASGDITSLINGVGGDATIQFMQFYSMFYGCTGLTQAPALPATTLADYCYDSMLIGCTGLTTAPSLPATTLANSCYNSMFSGCTGLTSAPALPATTLADDCYNSMFYGCTGLTQAPALPATTLADYCYNNMFNGCTGMTTAPSLPATMLADYCYNSMFSGCTGLTTAPSLPATMLANSCYNSMFSGCTGLTSAPALPATTLAEYCYNSMFSGCTGLTTAPSLPATTLAEYCYNNMFNGCTGITSHDVATLNNSQNTFQSNTSCASLTIHAGTPPTIENNTITGLKADCIIYVPAASVDAYKAAQYWSARASYIQAMP